MHIPVGMSGKLGIQARISQSPSQQGQCPSPASSWGHAHVLLATFLSLGPVKIGCDASDEEFEFTEFTV